MKCPHCGETIEPQVVGLTPPQYEMLVFVARCVKANGYAPSFQQIMNALGVSSKSVVHRVIHELVGRGAITMRARRNRSVVPTELGLRTIAKHLETS